MNKPKLYLSVLHLANHHINRSFQRTSMLLCYSFIRPFSINQQAHVFRQCVPQLCYYSVVKYFTNKSYEADTTAGATDVSDLISSGDDKNDCSSGQSQEFPDIKYILDGDLSLEKKLKVLFLEVEVFRQEGKRVPSTLQNNQWKELLHMTSTSARKKYLTYLWGIEMKRQSEKKKKEEKRLKKEQQYTSDNVDDGEIHYGLNRNSIQMRVYDTTMNQLYNNKLVQAIQFGQKIVVDCSYDQHMTPREAQNAAKQITYLFSENRVHQEPFNLYLCNANREGNTLIQLNKFINTLYEDHFPVNVTEKSYLELFPKENLIYLTPHCKDEMTTFNHDAIYIIGAMVDKINTEPLSLAKAKKEGLQMAKLPLERYLNWGSGGGKSLTLNQMMLILLEMKTSNDWEKALVHVPRRKLNVGEQPGFQYQAKYRLRNNRGGGQYQLYGNEDHDAHSQQREWHNRKPNSRAFSRLEDNARFDKKS